MNDHDAAMHDQGFRDGIKFIAKQLRHAADQVARPQYSHFQRSSDGKQIEAISRQGSPAYAKKLNELADEIERIANQ